MGWVLDQNNDKDGRFQFELEYPTNNILLIFSSLAIQTLDYMQMLQYLGLPVNDDGRITLLPIYELSIWPSAEWIASANPWYKSADNCFWLKWRKLSLLHLFFACMYVHKILLE